MKRRREVSDRLGFVFLGWSNPRPAVVLTFDLNVIPKPLNGPIPAEVKICNVDRAATVFDLFHAVEAFPHRSEVAFVLGAGFSVPGAFEFFCHVKI